LGVGEIADYPNPASGSRLYARHACIAPRQSSVKSRASVFVPAPATLCLAPRGSDPVAWTSRLGPRPLGRAGLSLSSRFLRLAQAQIMGWPAGIAAAAARSSRDGRRPPSLAAVWVTLAHKPGSGATMLTTADAVSFARQLDPFPSRSGLACG